MQHPPFVCRHTNKKVSFRVAELSANLANPMLHFLFSEVVQIVNNRIVGQCIETAR